MHRLKILGVVKDQRTLELMPRPNVHIKTFLEPSTVLTAHPHSVVAHTIARDSHLGVNAYPLNASKTVLILSPSGWHSTCV